MFRSSGSSVFPLERQGSSSSTGSQGRNIFMVSRAITKFKKLRKVAPESPPRDTSQVNKGCGIECAAFLLVLC
jgi:hypothetical protein